VSIATAWRMLMLVVAVIAVWSVSAPSAHAQISGGGTSSTSGGSTLKNTCDQYAGVTNRIASCIRAALGKATDAFYNPDTGIYPLVARAITGFLTIGIAVYGILAAFGMIEKVGRDTIMLIIKISMIGYFTTNVDLMYHELVGAMDEISEKVVEFTPRDGSAAGKDSTFSQIACIQNMKEAQGSSESGDGVVGPWMGMDCLIDTIIGIKGASTGGPKGTSASEWLNKNFDDSKSGLSRGMLAVFFTSMETSVMGLLLGVVGFVFIYGLLQLIIKALFVYLAGYIGIAFMMILAPIFVPLVLFQVTKQYFDKWVKLVIGFTLQPVIILVFISFNIAAVDLAAFSGNYSVMYRLAGEASRQKGFNLNDYLTKTGALAKKATTVASIKSHSPEAIPLEKLDTKGAGGAIAQSKCIESIMRIDAKIKAICDRSYPVRVVKESLDWEKLAEARDPPVTLSEGATKPEQQIANEVLAAAIFCGIVIFIMNQLFQIVPALAQDLLGDFGQSPNLFNATTGGGLPGAQQLQGVGAGLQNRISNMVTGR